jgi:sec-independent protein translocase protein TatC
MSSTANMRLIDHVKELRKRVFIAVSFTLLFSAISLNFYSVFIHFLITPFTQNLSSLSEQSLYVTSLFEGFILKFKLSLIFGGILALPIWLLQTVRFIFPGLKKSEKWIVSIVLFCSLLLTLFSIYMAYFKLIPFTISFMSSSGFIPDSVGTLMNFKQNISYIVQLIFFACLLFQLPLLVQLLLALNLVTRKQLLRSSKVVILLILVICALVTPPDFISQICLAIPLIFFYFLTIGIAKLFGWGNA